MNFVIGFLIVSTVLCFLVNVGAFIAEKVQKKKVEKISTEKILTDTKEA